MSHPVFEYNGNVILTITSFVSAMILHITEPAFIVIDVPAELIHWLQVVALGITIVTGGRTIYKWYKEPKKRNEFHKGKSKRGNP